MSLSAAQVASPKDYDFVFRKYRSFLYGVVYRSGIPMYSVEDASFEILTRMLGQDGLDRFDGELVENSPRVKAYLATYFSLGARAELTRIRNRAKRSVTLAALPDLADDGVCEVGCDDSKLLDSLLSLTTGDARHFIEVAAEHPSYAKARVALADEGWDTLRIRRAVKQARALVREHLCTHH
jgi:hypothetical protein